MKRTFGRFMSLLLVLAMVLAMVPAALAANQAYSVEPDSTIKIKTSITGFTVTNWESSDESVATVAAVSGSKTEAIVTGKKASNTAIRITATGTLANGRSHSEYFTVYVRDAYTLTLALSNSNINGTVALNQGDTRTLTATVTVGSSGVTAGNLANCEVHFTSDNDAISVTPANAKVTASTVGNYTTYKVEATVKAEKVGGATLTAQVWYQGKDGMKPSTSATATKTIGFRVSGAATISVTLPTAQQVLSLEAGGTSATLQPKVTGYSGTAQPKLLYLYDTKDNNLYVRPNASTTSATVEPYKACDATKIYICIADYNAGLTYAKIDQTNPSASIEGSYAVCTVSIKNKGMAVTSIEVMNNESVSYNGKTSRLQTLLDNGTMVFGLQDKNEYEFKVVDKEGKETTEKKTVSSTLIRDDLTLTARIKAPDSLLASAADLKNAYSRIEWTSSAPAVAKVGTTESDGKSATATIVPVAPGTATITAKVDGNVTATYNVTVYQGRAYKITEEPSIGETVGKMTQTELEALFKKESAKVEIQTSIYSDEVMIYELPVKTAKANGSDAAGYTFTYTLNGLKTATKEFFYNRSDPDDSGVTTTGKVTFSDISFSEQPANAAYKITDTIADLAMTASVSTGKIKSVVWYMNSDQTTGGVDKAIQTDKITDKPTNYRSVLSNLKQYITGTGTYVFYCRVTTDDGKYAETRKAIITITGENHINIVFNPTTVKAGGTFTITGTPQEYVSGKLTNVTGKTYTITWTSSDENIVKLSSKTSTNSSPSITATAKAGGQVTIKAETTIGAKKYAAEVKFTVTVPEADTVSLTLGENETYVQLDGSKLAAAVKTAAKVTPSTFTFESPANGTLYTSSAMSGTVSTTTKYSASEVSKMVYRPTRTTGTHTIRYAAYDGSAQIATGTINVVTSASTVEYHISANEKQQMVVSDFQRVYGSGLSTVTFGSNTDTRGALYKGSTTSSGKVGSEAYSVSTGSNLLKNVCFIAGSTTSKYTVTIPFTANGSSGQMNGQLVVYVNDTHTLNSTGASFRSMGIAGELTPENATGSTYITIDRVVGGKLYSAYTSIKNCTALTSKDFGSTKFYFSGSGSLDNLYILPLADSKSVEVSYTIDGSTKGTLSFKVNQQTASNQFTDVSGSYKWAANSVDFMYMNDIIKGNNTKNPKLFGPGAKMTRAMLVTVLYRAAGEPTVTGITNKFTDNKQGQYYYNAVLWASNMGIVNGATATTFDPNGNVTREQIAAILYRYEGSPTVTGSLSGYPDQAQVSSFAVTAMQWAVGTGIITGVTSGGRTTLSAKGNATRAQVAVMLHRFLTF
ncbi:MAG: S-layer homology domain-containing protein [Oscillospiraceae bacterium]